MSTLLKFGFVLGLSVVNAIFGLGQDSLNMIRLAQWNDTTLPVASPGNLKVRYSGCWGLAVNGREYAILGGARHVLVFDVTVPTDPQLVGKFEGTTSTVWREFKSYKNRVYAVSDATTEGLMIIDFSRAPDSIVQTYFSNELFSSAHTITLDTVSGRIYLNGSNIAIQGLAILDVSQDPDRPVLIGKYALPGGYVHDSYVRGDTLYASCGFNGYFIYDCRNAGVEAPKTIASLPPTGGYHHNSWLSSDGRYAYLTEEIPWGRPILVVDLEKMADNDLVIRTSFLDPLLPPDGTYAIPHNVYIKDNLLFNSQYEDGLLVYDISNPVEPKLIAYYDTHPQNTTYNTYFGCWGNYPWLPSGTIIAGDMQNGLQLLRLKEAVGKQLELKQVLVRLYPNPATDFLHVRWEGSAFPARVRLWNAVGQLAFDQLWPEGKETLLIPTVHLPAGLYTAEFLIPFYPSINQRIAILH
ncbi:MAG: choice-of-anchor B family protein [Saprospiraceae bacterium]|nr:choice-of-anchor B family protein [Saprospiraceae bacterium]MDW8483376.1 choice-of-anchor B family protein [Saprospiraceae bacterium]